MSRALRIYIAGPISNPDPREVEANIHRARMAMVRLIRMGHSPFCPHTMSADCEGSGISRNEWLRVDFDWLKCSDGILMLDGWRESEGAYEEYLMALAHQLPIYYDILAIPEVKHASSS